MTTNVSGIILALLAHHENLGLPNSLVSKETGNEYSVQFKKNVEIEKSQKKLGKSQLLPQSNCNSDND